MSALTVTAPFAVFTDINGDPLDAGYIYVGTVNLDPVANPVTVYWDSALTIPATQPIRTINGYPARNGSAANIFIDGTSYSIKVLNRRAQLCFSMANGVHVFNQTDQIPATQIDYTSPGAGAVLRTGQDKFEEWVSVKDFGAVGDGVTDDSAAINAATYYMYLTFGGGTVRFPPGTYLCESVLFPRSRVNWYGEAVTGYFATGANGVVIKRASALTILAYQTASLWSCRNIEFEGNAGGAGTYIFAKPPGGISLPTDDPLYPGDYTLGSGFYLYNCTLSSANYGIGNASSIGSINATDCMFRDFTTAILNVTDSTIDRCLFTGNTFAGISLNTGANRINNCFFEFNRNGSNVGYGIFIQSNSTEIQIQGCRFDRNAGQDIYIASGAKRPSGILIQGNFFNRGSWGDNQVIRSSVFAAGADDISVIGNTVKSYSSFPSTVMGVVAPLSLFVHSGCTGVIYRDNNTSALCREMPLTTASPSTTLNKFGNAWTWTQSGSGSDEWYLTDNYNTDDNPYIVEPQYISVNGSILDAGTAGALAVGEWDFADNDSLGFDTIYCRVTETGEPGLQDINCHYDSDPYPNQLNSSSYPTRSTDVQTDDWVDVYRNQSHAGRVLVTNNAVAEIASNILSVTVADGHGIVAGDWVFLDDAVTVSVTSGAYQVSSVTDAGGGNDYINLTYTAANAVGTIDIYTVTVETFILRTRKRCMYPTGSNDFGSMQATISVVAHGVSPAYRMNSEFPFTVIRTSAALLTTILNGSIIDHNSNLAHNWYDTSSDDNMSIDISSDILGDKLTIRVINTTADDFGYIIGIKR